MRVRSLILHLGHNRDNRLNYFRHIVSIKLKLAYCHKHNKTDSKYTLLVKKRVNEIVTFSKFSSRIQRHFWKCLLLFNLHETSKAKGKEERLRNLPRTGLKD